MEPSEAGDDCFGEIGVLAYDAAADLIQCHRCGRWFHKLTSFHLKKHGLDISTYKERYGLNMTTALETPTIVDIRRRHNARLHAERFLTNPFRRPKGSRGTPYRRRSEGVRNHRANEVRRLHQRRWTDEEILAGLRALQAVHGGVLCYADLERPEAIKVPTPGTIARRFGPWERVCALLGQPYVRSRTAPSGPGHNLAWTDDQLLAVLREAQATCGGVLTCAHLRRQGSGRRGKAGRLPSLSTVRARLGSWRRVCELLDQPYRSWW